MTRYMGRRTTAILAAASPDAAPGSNLLVNASAQAGAVSKRGWDAVTIPRGSRRRRSRSGITR
jgi:hypothetical protein